MTKKVFKLLLAGLSVFFFSTAGMSERNYTIPIELNGVRHPSMLLNGKWLFKFSPESRWTTIRVPGEVAMQGFAIKHDEPFFYKKEFEVPADYAGKCLILRFDGVYSHARLWINGQFVREHHGGFTRWETDVTSRMKPGKKNEIKLEVTDRLDEISYASGYAHHPIGGILRDVTLFALPTEHPYDMYVETDLDSLYQDATLRFVCSSAKEDAELELRLTDPKGHLVTLKQTRFLLTGDKEGQEWHLPVKQPLKWDAEHPHLYTLTVVVRRNGVDRCRFVRKIGFRKVEVKGNRMLVNGHPVKLRGACRHDIHPTLGRTTTAELDSLDALLFKQSNMNFVRTSHYPPSEKFLEYCDRYGIYVESESAVCFVNTYRQKNYAPGDTHNKPEYAERYLGQCKEMVKSFRSHPSIVLWSIGNESVYGTNFQTCWNWVKSADRTRPVIFSYPGSVGNKEKIYDILSMHYQDVNGNLDQWGMSTRNFQGHGIPALFDEWAHPACYTYNTLQTDPNIREFWGQSLDMMWSGLFDAPGGLGGAIWGYIDETFSLPEPKAGTSYWKQFARTAKPEDYQGNCVGYGEWGIVDVWRRQKPEFWSTKKAYSPIKILTDEISEFVPGQRIVLPVYNRFDHTDMAEVQGRYTYKGKKTDFLLSSIDPHQKGMLVLPPDDWAKGEPLLIEFYTSDGLLTDAYRFVLGGEEISYPSSLEGDKLTLDENDRFVKVRGEGFEIPFSKETGLIVCAKVGEEVLIEKGPFLHASVNLNHLTGAEVRKIANHYTVSEADWQKESFSYTQTKDYVCVKVAGHYKNVSVDFEIKITPDARLEFDYVTSGLPNGFLRETGLFFYLNDAVDHLDWKRKGYWNYYPQKAFAGNEGHVALYKSSQAAYGEKPVQAWQADTHEYYYWGDAGTDNRRPLTRMAKGMKENIYYYSLSGKGHRLSVVSSDASIACRISKGRDEKLRLYTNNRWDYPEIAWGNYCKTLEALPCFGKIKMLLK